MIEIRSGIVWGLRTYTVRCETLAERKMWKYALGHLGLRAREVSGSAQGSYPIDGPPGPGATAQERHAHQLALTRLPDPTRPAYPIPSHPRRVAYRVSAAVSVLDQLAALAADVIECVPALGESPGRVMGTGRRGRKHTSSGGVLHEASIGRTAPGAGEKPPAMKATYDHTLEDLADTLLEEAGFGSGEHTPAKGCGCYRCRAAHKGINTPLGRGGARKRSHPRRTAPNATGNELVPLEALAQSRQPAVIRGSADPLDDRRAAALAELSAIVGDGPPVPPAAPTVPCHHCGRARPQSDHRVCCILS